MTICRKVLRQCVWACDGQLSHPRLIIDHDPLLQAQSHVHKASTNSSSPDEKIIIRLQYEPKIRHAKHTDASSRSICRGLSELACNYKTQIGVQKNYARINNKVHTVCCGVPRMSNLSPHHQSLPITVAARFYL